ncbi:MAG: UbiA family prenyltransferase [Deltaproteobacteria bacterium]|nr:UbiA family prenyltransferase [Deltaproteobacteria bacterium]
MTTHALRRVSDLLEMIKFSHTLFALPFALTGMVLAARGVPSAGTVLGIVAAMVGARTAAMAWNRLADADLDARNPRTAGRHIPAGTVGRGEAWALVAGGVLLLEAAAWFLNPLCLKLSPIALAVIFLYPYTKRFTWLCHYLLGLALAAAPLGAWIAVTGSWSWRIAPLGLAVLLWTAGFDVLYALQDLEFDRTEGLHSIPQRWGRGRALRWAARLHLTMMALLVLQIPLFGLGWWYVVGLAVAGGLLLYEHALVTPYDLSRLDVAFFTMNGVVSVVVFLATFLDVVL